MFKKELILALCHQPGNIGCSQLHFPSHEEKLTTIHGQDTTERILKHEGDEVTP